MSLDTKPKPILVTVDDAASLLSVSAREIRNLINAGELERKYIGTGTRFYRVTYASLLAYADSLPEAKVEKGARR